MALVYIFGHVRHNPGGELAAGLLHLCGKFFQSGKDSHEPPFHDAVLRGQDRQGIIWTLASLVNSIPNDFSTFGSKDIGIQIVIEPIMRSFMHAQPPEWHALPVSWRRQRR